LTAHNPIRFDGTSPEAFVAFHPWRNTVADGGKGDLMAHVLMNTVDASYLGDGNDNWFFGGDPTCFLSTYSSPPVLPPWS
jgi:hypothetical protein